ncbi:uncharacterized protein LOC129592013 [Paramacrobiotus metropolitanus]|uniref:uncharacterized protein LOC129592013 n=1 Tax=Paramacrobiotus metropolitanus TaxID=2943436 RepID=UPI00244590D5|nr:uncharacterized protein LOC129592013 [Paramacrobiotus metropolitanus]
MWNRKLSDNSEVSVAIYSDSCTTDYTILTGTKKVGLNDVTNRNANRALVEKIAAKTSEVDAANSTTKVLDELHSGQSLKDSHEGILRFCREKLSASSSDLQDESFEDKTTTFRQLVKWATQCLHHLEALEHSEECSTVDYQVAECKYRSALNGLRNLVA